MEMAKVLALLLLAAVLEVGGDAAVRWGLYGSGRGAGLLLGVIVLFGYSLSVNAPRWAFGRLLGIYIALFYVISQVAAALFFREPVRAPALVGGALILSGAVVLTVWQPQ